jgi:ATP-dependent Clp protease ATP-binding subunit ClpB
VVNFKNTVVIMTSNIGSQWIRDLAGQDEEEMRSRVLEALNQHFRPEFLNRVDEIIIFHSLSVDDLVQIVDIQLGHLEKRLADHKITLHVTDDAKRYLAEEGYDPVYGARPLKRVIQRDLQDPLAKEMLEGKLGDGDAVRVSLQDGRLRFEKEPVLEHVA